MSVKLVQNVDIEVEENAVDGAPICIFIQFILLSWKTGSTLIRRSIKQVLPDSVPLKCNAGSIKKELFNKP